MSVEPADVAFKSKLDETSKKKAKEELNELNDEDRVLAVRAFRQWIMQQNWLKTPTDFGFLLRYLRARKHSQLGARNTLEKYWTCKTKYPNWHSNIDPADETMQEILKTGFMCSPERRNAQGRRIIISLPGRLESKLIKTKWGADNIYKAYVLLCEWLAYDENTQVNGIVTFLDYSNFEFGTFRFLSANGALTKFMEYYEHSLPCRMKGNHLYNEPTFFDVLFAMLSPMLKQKTKDRLKFHGKNMADVYKHIDKSLLPTEYLPDDYEGPTSGTIDEIAAANIADMMKPEFREYIKMLSSGDYGVDLQKKDNDDIPAASFRKLNVE